MTDMRPKVLIASLGTRGDVQPYVALARELAARNAEVVLTTGEGFEDMIEAAGARARPVPINYQELLQTTEVREALFSLKGMIKAARKNLNLQKEVARKLWQIGMDEKPDLILFNLKATVLTLVARRLNVPALPTSLQPVTAPTRDFPIALFGIPDLGSYLNKKSYGLGRWLMRAGLGPLVRSLHPEATAEINNPQDQIDGYMPDGSKALSLQAFSSALVPTPEDWPTECLPCGYWFTEPDPAYRPSDALEAFLQSGPAPTYLGFGSMPSKDPQHLTDTVLSALSKTGKRAILATGWGGLVKEKLPADLAGRVHLLDKAPHSWLFPRCAAIVHHGGAGTTHEAIRWGKPSLVCPVFGDQPFWGDRIHRIGAGPAAIKQKKLTADNLAKALKDLENPDYKSGAEKAADIIAKEPGASGTADLLLDQFTRVPA